MRCNFTESWIFHNDIFKISHACLVPGWFCGKEIVRNVFILECYIVLPSCNFILLCIITMKCIKVQCDIDHVSYIFIHRILEMHEYPQHHNYIWIHHQFTIASVRFHMLDAWLLLKRHSDKYCSCAHNYVTIIHYVSRQPWKHTMTSVGSMSISNLCYSNVTVYDQCVGDWLCIYAGM